MDRNEAKTRDAAIIGGCFVFLAAMVTGIFLVINTLVQHQLVIQDAAATAFAQPNRTVVSPADNQAQSSPKDLPQAADPPQKVQSRTIDVSPTNPPQIVQPNPVAPTQLSKCDTIQQGFPQSADAIAKTFGISSTRGVQVLHERCGSSVVDGFVYHGAQVVEFSVPADGCIDASPNDYYSEATEPNGVGGLRAYSGKVRAPAVTFRTWCN